MDLDAALRLAGLAIVIALLPLAWVWLRARGADARVRLAALTALTLFLTFDLVVFGAFTRLSDSGLGCPDWPGCYGEATPFGARDEIHAAQRALPDGPVTWSKAWIEMVHRYLAMTVGVLIVAMTAFAWRERRRLPHSAFWPTLTLVWVVVQGLFGKYTVTLKLYPAVVTLHLLGGLALLALLAVQHARLRSDAAPALAPALRRAGFGVTALVVLQIALGGWVSTNYAVLACSGFPQCNGEWWPAMDFGQGFTLLRELGRAGHGGWLPFEALVAIQMAHRLFALVVTLALGAFAWRLTQSDGWRRYGRVLGALLGAQALSGLSNVVLGWPLVAALAHSAGAAALVLVLALLLARGAPSRRAAAGEPTMRRAVAAARP
jgi:cytochrome c oxidase assembly protein subunit 15